MKFTLLYTYRWQVGIVLLAFFSHALCFFVVTNATGGTVLDTVRVDDGFYELAENVIAGNGFSWSQSAPYEPNPMRTPGYVYMLAALISLAGIAGAAWIQLIAASSIPLLGMAIAERITNTAWIGRLTGIILALDPTLALLSFTFYTETFFLILFLSWLLLTIHYLEKRTLYLLVTSAIFLGVAILTKTSAQYIPLLLVPLIVWHFGTKEWKRSLVHTGVYLLIIGAILTPWVMRNYTLYGTVGLSAQMPFVLYTNFAPAVLSVTKGSPFSDEIKTFLTPEEYKGDAITLANGDEYKAKALAIIQAHPFATVYIVSKSLFTFFTHDGFYSLFVKSGYSPANFLLFIIVARLMWIAITIAAFIGACMYLLEKRSQLALFLILLVAYFALTSTIAAFGTNPRYRLPVDPIIIAFAAIGAMYLYKKYRILLNKAVGLFKR